MQAITWTGYGPPDRVLQLGEVPIPSIADDEVPGLVDEIPVLAVLAAVCPGRSEITGAGELRHKESDRLERTVLALRGIGKREAMRRLELLEG